MAFCRAVTGLVTMWTLTASRAPDHSDGIVDSVLIVDDEFLRQAIDDLAAGRQLNRTGRIDRAAHVVGSDFAIATGDGDDGLTVEAQDVRAGEIDRHFFGFDAAHSFGFFDRPLDRFDRRIGIHDHAFAQAARFGFADADDIPAARLRPARRRYTSPCSSRCRGRLCVSRLAIPVSSCSFR